MHRRHPIYTRTDTRVLYAAVFRSVQRERREAWQAWRALPESEGRQLRAAAKAYSALQPGRQQEVRAKYDALDGSERRGWMLGPVLGADYPDRKSTRLNSSH